jgi:hypothetical protein
MGVFSPNKRRGTEDAADMARSMLVVFAVVLVVGVYFLFARPHPNPVRVVDGGPALRAARASAPYHVLAPVGLGPGWRLTSARDDVTKHTVSVHLGYVTPQGHYAAFEEAGSRTALGTHEVTLNATPPLPKGAHRLRPVTIDGAQWQQSRDGRDTVLDRFASTGALVTVRGDAPLGELVTLATALR